MPGGVLSVDWPFEEPVAAHEELYISHTLQRSADRSLSPKKIKIVPHETQRMFHAGMVALKGKSSIISLETWWYAAMMIG